MNYMTSLIKETGDVESFVILDQQQRNTVASDGWMDGTFHAADERIFYSNITTLCIYKDGIINVGYNI